MKSIYPILFLVFLSLLIGNPQVDTFTEEELREIAQKTRESDKYGYLYVGKTDYEILRSLKYSFKDYNNLPSPDFIKDEYPNIIFDHAREKYPEMDWGVDLDNDEKNIDSPPEKNPKVRSPLSKFKIGVIFLLILIIVSSISTIEGFFIFLKKTNFPDIMSKTKVTPKGRKLFTKKKKIHPTKSEIAKEPYKIADLSMRWYQYITYFLLPISALLVLMISVVGYFGDKPLLVLIPKPILFSSTFLFGVLIYGLHKKSTWSWKLLILCLLLIMNLLFYRISQVESFLPNLLEMPNNLTYLIAVVFVNAFVIFPNYIYFNKRKHLFIN